MDKNPAKELSKNLIILARQALENKYLKDALLGPVPRHIGIIMDGNRRYAKSIGLGASEGHTHGKNKLNEMLEWCKELDIKAVTVYAYSTENLKRTESEKEALMTLFENGFLDAAEDERVHKYGIQIRAIGKQELLPERVREAIKYAEEKTKNYSNYYYNIAVGYGGRQEIVDAVKDIARDAAAGKLNPEEICENTISERLYTSDIPDPELILRTSGEERISNFLLWQSAYSELYFTDVYWPSFRKIDLLRAIREYQKRKRRFGK